MNLGVGRIELAPKVITAACIPQNLTWNEGRDLVDPVEEEFEQEEEEDNEGNLENLCGLGQQRPRIIYYCQFHLATLRTKT